MAERFTQFLIFFPIFLFSLSFHEAAHAWMANKLGDSTARSQGRMTLNPLAHIDWIGTVLFPLLMFLLPGLLLFGWAKPVPVNPTLLKGGMKKGNLKVAAAGPLSNILLALVFAGLLHVMVRQDLPVTDTLRVLYQMGQMGVLLNLVLAFFNLIPIPPLDGGNIFAGFLPDRYLPILETLNRYGFLILLALLYLGILRILMRPAYFFAEWILP